MTLPAKTEDLDAIRALLVGMLQDGKSTEIVELVIGILQKLKEQNDDLQLRLARLLRERLARKSEKIPVEQSASVPWRAQLGCSRAGEPSARGGRAEMLNIFRVRPR